VETPPTKTNSNTRQLLPVVTADSLVTAYTNPSNIPLAVTSPTFSTSKESGAPHLTTEETILTCQTELWGEVAPLSEVEKGNGGEMFDLKVR
jgi:hypothetical protein